MPAPAGKEETPHKHEHEHSPLDDMEPEPLPICGGETMAAAELLAGGATYTAVLVAIETTVVVLAMVGGLDMVELPDEYPLEVPFCCIAMDWNMAKVFDALGLMAKTIPLPQWPF